MTFPKFVRVKEAAALVGMQPNTIRKWIRDGVLRAYCPGGKRYLIDPDDLKACIQRGMVGHEAP